MSTRLIQDLHAGISRRDWSAVEVAANRLRDDIDETRRILAGTGIGSLPNDYPLPRLAADALSVTITDAMVQAAKAAYWHEVHNGGGYSDKCYEAALRASLSPTRNPDMEDRNAMPTEAMVEYVARAVRKQQFERTRRIASYDPDTPLTENELADAAAALSAALALPHETIGVDEAWELFDSRRFLHGHRETMRESFNTVLKGFVIAPLSPSPSIPEEKGGTAESVVEGLIEFAKECLRTAFDGGSLDGGDIQDMGVKYGLLTETVFDPDIYRDNNGYAVKGDAWFVFAGPLASPTEGQTVKEGE